MRKMIKKLGFQVVLIVMLILAVSLAAINIVTINTLHVFTDTILMKRARVGMQVLEDRIEEERADLENAYRFLAEDNVFLRAVAEKDARGIQRIFRGEFSDNEDYFMVITDNDGKAVFRTSSYPFSSYNVCQIGEDAAKSGIVSADGTLAVMHTAPIVTGNGSFILTAGLRLSSSEWLGNIRESVDCDLTLFNGNIRLSSTLGAEVIGTPMGEDIREAVLGEQLSYNGKAVINNAPYYVSYDPMYDVNGRLVGAYFAGSNAAEANSEFANVVMIVILSAVLITVMGGIIIFIFSNKMVTEPINQVTILANEMQTGKLGTTEVHYNFRDNEVGEFAKILAKTKNALHEVIDDESDILNALSEGDFTKIPHVEYPGDFENIRTNILKIEHDLTVSLNEITVMTAEKERLSAELGVAAKIQADMMPFDFPEREEIELYASMTPAKEVGGDFYDFFMIDDDHICLIMADVSGKGVPAALFMVIAKTLLKIHASADGGNVSDILRDVNNTLCEGNVSGLFVTVWLGILTLSTGELDYANAGHEYPAIKRENGKYELIRGENNPPLACMENVEYTKETIQLYRNDSVFLYTDGVPEAKNAEGERFGTDRMIEILNNNAGNDMITTLTDMKKNIDMFAENIDPFDDITMLGFIWKGSDTGIPFVTI